MSYLDGLLTTPVVSSTTAQIVARIGGPNGGALVIGSGVTATPNPDGGFTLAVGTGQALNGSSLLLGSNTPPQYQLYAQPTVTSTAFTSATLATVATGTGTTVIATATVVANLGQGQVNANLGPTLYTTSVITWRVGGGSLNASSPSFTNNVTAPFTNGGSGVQGSIGWSVSGTNVLLQGNGFNVLEAWTSGHAYVAGNGSTIAGQFVTANGNVYCCTTGGTASGSAPSGTGTGLGTGAIFAYVAAGSVVPVAYTVAKLEVITG